MKKKVRISEHQLIKIIKKVLKEDEIMSDKEYLIRIKSPGFDEATEYCLTKYPNLRRYVIDPKPEDTIYLLSVMLAANTEYIPEAQKLKEDYDNFRMCTMKYITDMQKMETNK